MQRALWILAPVAALFVTIAYLTLATPLEVLTRAAPPVEELSVETVKLSPGLISLQVRADGSQPITIAQVQVDGAWRAFEAETSATLERLQSTRIDIPYPWIEGEAHHIRLLTATGVTFDHTIDVAVDTNSQSNAWQLGLVGALLGIAPVAIGLLAYPAVRSAGPGMLNFLLALTIGLLVYLLIDTLNEGLELGTQALGRLRGTTVVWVAAGLTAVGLIAFGRRHGAAPAGVHLSFFIALGIGLHNLGEGLVVGAALVTGAAALASFLVVGFVIHNVTEGIGISAPLADGGRPSWLAFPALALLAGGPAIVGVYIGSAALNPYLAAIFFGMGAGAILQVIIEVASYLARKHGKGALLTPSSAGGVAAGLAVMYMTALLV